MDTQNALFPSVKNGKKLIDKYFSLDGPRLYLQLVDLKVGLTSDDRAMLSFLIEKERLLPLWRPRLTKLTQQYGRQI